MKLPAVRRALVVVALMVAGVLMVPGCSMSVAGRPAPAVVGTPGQADFQPGIGGDIGSREEEWQGYTGGVQGSATAARLPRLAGRALPEEVWIIIKPPHGVPGAGPGAVAPGFRPVSAPTANDDLPGCGALLARRPGQTTDVPVPLKHTDVKASIAGYIAAVDVTQQFHNPYDEKIEAIYVFPLPHDAAINEFVMTIGERRIRGIVRERREAQQVYDEAKAQGYTVALMTQERPNVFTQKVANIEPGREIDVNVRYYHTLAYDDGWYQWVFPMVVGPRYNPAWTGNGVGAVARGHQGASGQRTEVQYLRPSERSGHDISLSVDIHAGVPIEEIVCDTHQTMLTSAHLARGEATLVLSDKDTVPNRDLVLRFRVAGRAIKSAFLAHRDDRGGYFTLMVLPPSDLGSLPRESMEMVFLLDCSESMVGQPLASAKAATAWALNNLDARDRFQVVTFANTAASFAPAPLPADERQVARATRFVAGLHAGGYTEMLTGVQAVLDQPGDAGRRRVIALMTDGFIGNETEVMSAVARGRGDIRFLSFGVGAAPNRYLIEGIARVGGGAAGYASTREDARDVMERYFQCISHPALTDLHIDWGGLEVSDVYPRRVPDLYVGRPVILTGRFRGRATRAIHVTGHVGEQTIGFDVPGAAVAPGFRPVSGVEATEALPALWARAKISDLSDRTLLGLDSTGAAASAEAIRHLAIDYGLLSDATAFIAVDASQRTTGDHGTTVPVPVPVPEGTRYDTAVVK